MVMLVDKLWPIMMTGTLVDDFYRLSAVVKQQSGQNNGQIQSQIWRARYGHRRTLNLLTFVSYEKLTTRCLVSYRDVPVRSGDDIIPGHGY